MVLSVVVVVVPRWNRERGSASLGSFDPSALRLSTWVRMNISAELPTGEDLPRLEVEPWSLALVIGGTFQLECPESRNRTLAADPVVVRLESGLGVVVGFRMSLLTSRRALTSDTAIVLLALSLLQLLPVPLLALVHSTTVDVWFHFDIVHVNGLDRATMIEDINDERPPRNLFKPAIIGLLVLDLLMSTIGIVLFFVFDQEDAYLILGVLLAMLVLKLVADSLAVVASFHKTLTLVAQRRLRAAFVSLKCIQLLASCTIELFLLLSVISLHRSWQLAQRRSSYTLVYLMASFYTVYLVVYSMILVRCELSLLLPSESLSCVRVSDRSRLANMMTIAKSVALRFIEHDIHVSGDYDLADDYSYSPVTAITTDSGFTSLYDASPRASSSKKSSQVMIRYDQVPPVAYSQTLDKEQRGALFDRP